MTLPFGTRYVYFAVALITILVGSVGLAQTPPGRRLLQDAREELNLVTRTPTTPTPPSLDTTPTPTFRPVVATPLNAPALEETTVLVQNESLRARGDYLLLRSEKNYRFLLEDPAEWSVLAEYASTVSPEITSHPLEFINLDSQTTPFTGTLRYQEPRTGRTFRLETDGVAARPLARIAEYNARYITYAFVPETKVIESQNLGLTTQYRLNSPEAIRRTIDLKTLRYEDETITLPAVVTEKLSDIYMDSDTLYVDGEYLEGSAPVGPPTYAGYRAEGNVIYQGEEEVARIQLRSEVAGLEAIDFQDGLLYLKSVLPGEYNPGSNLLTYDPETGEFAVVFTNDYATQGSRYVFWTAERYSLEASVELDVSRAQPTVEVSGQHLEFQENSPEMAASLDGLTPTQVEEARTYAANLIYAVPSAFQGASTENFLTPGTAINYAGHKVLTVHALANSTLRVLPKDSAFVGSDQARTLLSLPEFFETGNSEGVRGQDRLPGWANLFYGFHPFVYSGPAQYHDFVESVEVPGYRAAWVVPYSQCYGGCTYGYHFFLEHETGYALLTTARSAHVYPFPNDPVQECGDAACVEEKFRTLPELTATKENLLREIKKLGLTS